MRSVNLIPPEDRRGGSAPNRSGPLAYVVVATLALILAGVFGVVSFNKRVADRQTEATALEARAAEAEARASSLAAFISFQQLHDTRVLTIDQLAKSRFDWERVLRELSYVLPNHVSLTGLSGSVAPGVGEEGGTALRDSIPGPALTMTGCGKSHRDIARLVAAMKDIDGVTRVIAINSTKSESVTAPSTASADDQAPATDANCETNTSPGFSLVAAFDGIAPTTTPDGAPVAPPAATATATPTSTPAAAPTTASDGGVAGAQDVAATSRRDVADSRQRAEKAKNLIPGG